MFRKKDDLYLDNPQWITYNPRRIDPQPKFDVVIVAGGNEPLTFRAILTMTETKKATFNSPAEFYFRDAARGEQCANVPEALGSLLLILAKELDDMREQGVHAPRDNFGDGVWVNASLYK